MYGILNKAIEDFITENYGLEKWETVKEKSGVEVEFFLSNEPYDDSITYQLIDAAAEVLGIPVREVLNSFGEHWVLKTGLQKYGSLMEAGGTSLREFLINLPFFHDRVLLIYPKLTPPEFKVSDAKDHSVHVHYYSQRTDLQEFVRGLLNGLGKLYNTPTTVEMIQSRDNGHDHEVYKVSWQ